MENWDNGDTFRALADICTPDPRQTILGGLDSDTGKFVPKRLEDHHTRITEFRLHEFVPEDIRIHFDTARNLLLYSWFVWRFMTVAEAHAFASLEYALRERVAGSLGPEPSLQNLLEYALKQNWFRDKDIRRFQRMEQARAEYVELISDLPEEVRNSFMPQPKPLDDNFYIRRLVLPQIAADKNQEKKGSGAKPLLSGMRNLLAHGSSSILSSAYLTLELCCDLINQLYEKPRE